MQTHSPELKTLAGKFIVFEGPDGSGKTTQLDRFESACLTADLTITRVREPGGTPLGEAVREILLSKATDNLAMPAEMLLYMAARAQLVETVIKPALNQGNLVLADRFVPSTLAYQGSAGGINTSHIQEVANFATDNLIPDLVILIDVDQQTAASRLGKELDRIESRPDAFHKKVRDSYLAQASAHPDHWLVVDGSPDQDTVWSQLNNLLLAHLNNQS